MWSSGPAPRHHLCNDRNTSCCMYVLYNTYWMSQQPLSWSMVAKSKRPDETTMGRSRLITCRSHLLLAVYDRLTHTLKSESEKHESVQMLILRNMWYPLFHFRWLHAESCSPYCTPQKCHAIFHAYPLLAAALEPCSRIEQPSINQQGQVNISRYTIVPIIGATMM